MNITDQRKSTNPSEFVKRVDELLAQQQTKYIVEKFGGIGALSLLFGGKEEITSDAFKKKLRQNSRKHYKDVLHRSKNCCEICRWSLGTSSCLNVHHIIPVSDYSNEYYQKKTHPDKDFETANLVVLCPNCHSLVHFMLSSLSNKKKKCESVYQGLVEKYSQDSISMLFRILDRSLFRTRFNNMQNTIFEEATRE